MSTSGAGTQEVVVLRHEEAKASQWPSGLAKQTELFLFPPNGNFSEHRFLVYISRDEMVGSCTFPYYAGCTRLIARLSGGPLLLNHNNSADSHIVKPLKFYEFEGDWSTYCELDDEKSNEVSDLHVYFKSNAFSAAGEIFKSHRLDPDDKAVEVQLACNSCTVLYHIQGPDVVVRHGHEEYTLRAHDSIAFNPKLLSDMEGDEQHCEVQFPEGAGDECYVACVRIEFEGEEPFDDQPTWVKHAESSVSKQEMRQVDKASSPMLSHPTRTGFRKLHLSTTANKKKQSLAWEREPYQPPVAVPPMPLPPPSTIDTFDVKDFEAGLVHSCWLNVVQDGFGEWVRVPLIIARGVKEGPVIGITAAVHGNELNGIPCVHRLMGSISVQKLSGTIVACPCVNTPGYTSFSRHYRDGVDLNRTFPGKEDGTQSQVFCHNILQKLIRHFNYHLDLHTASFGRINSYYVRADMNDPEVAEMTWLCNPQIILHNSGQDGTLRGCATALGIKCLTIEIGNPQSVQTRFVSWTYAGCRRILDHLGMYSLSRSTITPQPPNRANVALCRGGYWMYTKHGGVLEVFPNVNSYVREGELIARVKNIFGNVVEEVYAPVGGGVTVGRSSNPVAYTGDRVIHIGIVHDRSLPLPEAGGENY